MVGCDARLGKGGASSTRSRLESAVTSGAMSFDFAADPKFSWGRMYVFDCYSSRASVEKTLGFPWPDFSKTTIESSDSVVLVVFLQNGAVVDWYEQPRTIELGHLANEKGYSRTEAVFGIDRSGGRVELMSSTTPKASSTKAAGYTVIAGNSVASNIRARRLYCLACR
jgi:hypothetical protein